MPKFKCEYEDGDVLLSTKVWKLNVVADDHRQAYEKFIKEVGVFKYRVYVGKGIKGEYFSDHIEAENRRIHEREKVEGEQSVSQATNELEDLEIEYQESGWARFLNVCGCLNFILFVIGVIWLFNARSSSDQFMAMNLTIIGLIAAINSFFFAFLVNTFTRIQHNTHLTTLELIKLNKKNDSDN